jgi:hypothetical protein
VAHFEILLLRRMALPPNFSRQPVDYRRSGPDLSMPAACCARASPMMDFPVG